MLNYQQKRLTTTETIRSAREALIMCVLIIGLLTMSSLTLAENRQLYSSLPNYQSFQIRFGSSAGESVSTRQAAFVFHAAAPRWLHANRLEFGIGAISQAEESRPFFSLGPVWRWVPTNVEVHWFIDFGFSPTLLGGTAFTGKDLGGNLHFTSSLAIGRQFGRRSASTISMRIQHMSNGGLNRLNPGVDMIALSFTYRPERHGHRQAL